MNKYRQNKAAETAVKAEQTNTKAPRQVPGENIARNFIVAVNVFSYFDRTKIISLMPYIFFLTLLAMIYIGNTYYAEHTIRDIDRTEKELRELRSEYTTGKSELMYHSKLSEVAVAIAPRGISESRVAPKKIIIHTASSLKQ